MLANNAGSNKTSIVATANNAANIGLTNSSVHVGGATLEIVPRPTITATAPIVASCNQVYT
jgi:hypothetical protein